MNTTAPEGTRMVWDMQRQAFIPLPPDELDDNHEIWIVKNGRPQPERELTEREERDLQIYLHLKAAIELLGFEDE
jgi:hypothetical protein